MKTLIITFLVSLVVLGGGALALVNAIESTTAEIMQAQPVATSPEVAAILAQL